uniref:Uncharacterized protein n=1 Tax=Salix viminalis TaxID=40686 RepID=A0A6N2L5C1_SALVM
MPWFFRAFLRHHRVTDFISWTPTTLKIIKPWRIRSLIESLVGRVNHSARALHVNKHSQPRCRPYCRFH